MTENIKRILCVGDSLGLPRKEVPFEDTWYSMLSKEMVGYEFIPKFQRALTTKYLVDGNAPDYLEYYKPDIVVLQVGIVDCAPRYFNESSIIPKVINRLPPEMNTRVWEILKKYKSRKPENAYVIPRLFSQNLRNYLFRCEKVNIEKLIYIKIAQPGIKMKIKNPFINSQVDLYNDIIDLVCKDFCFVTTLNPWTEARDEFYISDGYHISKTGAELISSLLCLLLKGKQKYIS